jgi:hypothetical protein
MVSTADTVRTVPAGPPPPDAGAGLSKRAVAWRVAAHAAWIIALAIAVVARIGRFGFNPTDQGFVLSLSWRLLEGSIPHVDLISPRPLGSAVLHLIDFAIPAPLFVSSAVIAMVQVILSTVACIALITRTSPLEWGVLRTGLVAAASVLNLHTFTLMAWHTIDGIFLTTMGWWLLDAGLRNKSAWRRRIGLFLLGFAVMTKQSFMFAVPAGVLILLFHPAVGIRTAIRTPAWWRRTIVDLLCLGAFPLVYAGVVTAAGGLKPMIEQLTGGTGAWGEHLFNFWGNPFVTGDIRRHILMVTACVLVAATAWILRNRLGAAAPWIRLLPVVAAAVITIYALVQAQLAFPADWTIKLLWILVAVAILDAVVHKHFPWRPLLIVLLGYMSSLSWGYVYPGLVCGIVVLSILELLAASVPEIQFRQRWLVVPGAIVAIAALAATSYLVIDKHDDGSAVDRPQGELTADLGVATPQLRWIRSSQDGARYMTQIADCLKQHPASKVAIFPDNSFLYPAFKVHNPFPMDWPLALELVGDSRQKMLDVIPQLNRDGDYLVLFPTVTAAALRTTGHTPAEVPVDAPIQAGSGLEAEIKAGLTGQQLTCGSFVAIWQPAGPRN